MTRTEMIARLNELEREKYILSMKDRWNDNDFSQNARLSSEIREITEAVGEKVTVTRTRNLYTAEDLEQMTSMLSALKAIENPDRSTRDWIERLEYKLENTVETWVETTWKIA